MDTKSFICKVAPGAVNTMCSRGILASLSIAQAALESGWGEHAPGNNLFGIKANGWKGATQVLITTEVIKGKKVIVKDIFRAYPSWAASIDDHAAFLISNKRYKNLIGGRDYRIACQNIQADGYSTAPNYAQVLISIIEKYGLARYDKAAPITQVDCPKTGQVYDSDVPFGGWAVSVSGVKEVEILLDNKAVAKISSLEARSDVQKIINSTGVYLDADHSGYSGKIPQSMLSEGKHTLIVDALTRDGSASCRKTVEFIKK